MVNFMIKNTYHEDLLVSQLILIIGSEDEALIRQVMHELEIEQWDKDFGGDGLSEL
jgi:hypothetical protein